MNVAKNTKDLVTLLWPVQCCSGQMKHSRLNQVSPVSCHPAMPHRHSQAIPCTKCEVQSRRFHLVRTTLYWPEQRYKILCIFCDIRAQAQMLWARMSQRIQRKLQRCNKYIEFCNAAKNVQIGISTRHLSLRSSRSMMGILKFSTGS